MNWKDRAKSMARSAAGAAIPGAGAAMDVAGGVAQHVRARRDKQEEHTMRFKSKDADQHGAARYSTANHVYHDGEVTAAQQRLAGGGYLQQSDVDGCVGPGTLRAIEAWEIDHERDFFSDEPLERIKPGEMVMVSPRAKHISQGADEVRNIEIPGLTPDGKQPLNRPVVQIGCASISVIGAWDFYAERDIDFADGLHALIDAGCYNAERDLVWGRACEVISEDCGAEYEHREVSRYDALNCLRDGVPVLCHAGRGHWVLAVGYGDKGTGIVYNDPKTRYGDGYTDPVRNCERQGKEGYNFDRYMVIHEA